MSVYTPVGRDEFEVWLKPLNCGRLLDLAGIAAGMQNSNYFVSTETGRFVLTLFESLTPAQLDFYLDLQAHLAERGIPCPQPLAGDDGRRWRWLNGKPAALLTCLSGGCLERLSEAQYFALGEQLAHLHLAAADFPDPLSNPCGAVWRQVVGKRLLSQVSPSERLLLEETLNFEASRDFSNLPRGVIHADLFRDNLLWDSCGQLSGVLDFYFAGEDFLLFDLAVVANDSCPDGAEMNALIAGYASIRPLTVAEQAAWPAMRRVAALRFWLLRLAVRHQPRTGDVVTIKNPDEFRALLERLRLAEAELPR